MDKDRFLTRGWNNALTLGLGSILLGYVYFVTTTSVLSDTASFIGLVVLGVVY
jgi:hypothetical protein